MKLPSDFLNLSAVVGSQPLLVQAAGGNTSIKIDGQLWIKASGTLLADATKDDIFVAVDPARALRELEGEGDGSCRSALIDADCKLRPSIETTFHALLPNRTVFHFHSVATICHAISDQGRDQLDDKLSGIAWVRAPYRKPGIPLTKAIRDAIGSRRVNVVVLDNHGVIVVGDTVSEVAALIDDLESRLELPVLYGSTGSCDTSLVDIESDLKGWQFVSELAVLACDPTTFQRATSGTYYPDHAVFLGPALPSVTLEKLKSLDVLDTPFPAVLVENVGVFLKTDASASHRAMLTCLHDVLVRLPSDWTLDPIGASAEQALLDWDAEKYRQILAK